MNTRKIREDLGKSRTCIQRRDYQRAIYLFCSALKELGQQGAPMDLRSDIRTTLTDLCADPVYKNEYQQPQPYQPGKERDLLIFFNNFYKQLMSAEDEEDYETALKRKLDLDRCINDGKSFLNRGMATEADDCFARAFQYYKNEFGVYSIMARAMMGAGHYVRALGYIKKGLAEKADDQDLRRLGGECLRLRAQAGR